MGCVMPTKRRALVIGIDEYAAPVIPNLTYATADASAIAETLELPEYGFEVMSLLNDGATRQAVLRELATLRGSNAELSLFYFAGHGLTTELGSYLVTHDGTEYEEGIELNRVVELLGSARGAQRDFVAVLDCCKSGAVTMPETSPYEATGIAPEEIQRSFRRGPEGRRAVLASCLADQLAGESPSLGHGVFTYFILDGLLGAAADHEGRVTLSSLHEYAAGQLATRSVQKPVFYGAFAGNSTIAEGLEPRLGPPLEQDQRLRLVETAGELIDDHRRHRMSPEWEDWLNVGFRAAAQDLTMMTTWFERQTARYPQLLENAAFRERYGNFQRFRAELGTLTSGTRVQRGTARRALGEGAFGSVWCVSSEDDDPPASWAYKVYHPNELTNVDKAHRFRRGYDAMRSLDHPRIVKVSEYTEAPLGFYMEYVEGSNLKGLNPAATLPQEECVALLAQVAEAVHHAHTRKVVHRDIKPENIVCRYDAERGGWDPFLTDFDLAWISTATQVTREGLGNLLYAAPEQLVNFTARAVSGFYPSLDVFSMGQLVYFCLTGTDPNPTRLAENETNFARTVSNWPSAEAAGQMRALYTDMTQYLVRDRLQSMDAVVSRLRAGQRLLLPGPTEQIESVARFLVELGFTFSGDPVDPGDIAAPEQSVASFSFESTSQQTQLYAEARKTENESLELKVHVVPGERVGFEGQTNEAMRRKMNQRVDRVLRKHSSASRRSGRSGSYSVYVDLEELALTREGVEEARAAISEVVTLIETQS